MDTLTGGTSTTSGTTGGTSTTISTGAVATARADCPGQSNNGPFKRFSASSVEISQ